MMLPSGVPITRHRRLLAVVLGGCAALSACAALACAMNIVYWTLAARTATPAGAAGAGHAEVGQSPEAIEAGLADLPAGDAARGVQMFNSAGCRNCHGSANIAPSLDGVGARAAMRRPDYSAGMYLYESVVYPNAYVVDGFRGGIMPQDFGQRLDQQELAGLVAYRQQR